MVTFYYSIIRYCRFLNSKTHCLPGATVRKLLDKLPDILQAAPATITTIIIHVGTNDTSLHQSEITKIEFRLLFDFLSRCGKTVLISGPLPALGRGDVRFSRIQALHSWLKYFSSTYNYGYIDNFTLFWFRSSCYNSDGLHINPLGNRILTANIVYAIHSHKMY
uniref:SGNH hydrolase-type esterase domain-containing protein n=1 Tax=Neogobius melanostomus TaxID=47308 RepID=A0A8C6SPY5_9GOBI